MADDLPMSRGISVFIAAPAFQAAAAIVPFQRVITASGGIHVHMGKHVEGS